MKIQFGKTFTGLTNKVVQTTKNLSQKVLPQMQLVDGSFDTNISKAPVKITNIKDLKRQAVFAVQGGDKSFNERADEVIEDLKNIDQYEVPYLIDTVEEAKNVYEKAPGDAEAWLRHAEDEKNEIIEAQNRYQDD